MASEKHDDSRQSRDDAARALVYVPCPACGKAVQLLDENRVVDEPDTYGCPNCGARLVLTERD
jgi:predicted RNA-binding Zn-ribbon protein involved in translation (DUF1610 family)